MLGEFRLARRPSHDSRESLPYPFRGQGRGEFQLELLEGFPVSHSRYSIDINFVKRTVIAYSQKLARASGF